MKTRTVKVRFTATFEAEVFVAEGENLRDAVCDVDVPENDQCKYVEDSFEVESVKENGKEIEWEDDEEDETPA